MSRDQSTTVSYRALFRHREFSALFCADTVSRTGGQLGKVALSALVYERTDSSGLAALTFAISYLPGLLGGPLLGALADRLPRRSLMTTCDLLRSVLTAAIAFLPLGIPVAYAILLTVELVRVPFGAARMAILADILEGDRFTAGNALVGSSQQAVQVLGFGLGGFVTLAIGPQTALAIHAATYLFSALVVLLLVRRRPAPGSDGKRKGLLADAAEGLRVVATTRRMPTLFVLLFIGPTALGAAEGLAIPYGYELGGGQALGGLLLAAAPSGSVVGLALYGRMALRTRERYLISSSLVVGLSIATAGAVPLAFGRSGVPFVLVALFLAGVGMGHMAHLQASIVQLISSEVRGRVIGLANTVLQLGQAMAVVVAGTIAEGGSVGIVLCSTGGAAASGTLLVFVFGAPYAGRHRAEGRPALRRRHHVTTDRHPDRQPRPTRIPTPAPARYAPVGPRSRRIAIDSHRTPPLTLAGRPADPLARPDAPVPVSPVHRGSPAEAGAPIRFATQMSRR